MGIGSDGSMPVWIAIATFIFTVGGSLLGVGWRAKGIQSSLKEEIADKDATHERKTLQLAADLRSETERRFDTARRERSAEIDLAGRAYGEVANALRQKIHEVETWSRDNFVREQVFQNFLESVTKSNENLRADMNANYKQLNEKLDRMMERERDRNIDHR